MYDYIAIKKTLRRFEQFTELKELELELIDNLGSVLTWVIHFSKKNNIPLENIHHLQYLYRRTNNLMNELINMSNTT